MRRHHLIEEAKSELDVAYEEVKRAENKIMELEQKYNDKIKAVRKANGGDYDTTITSMMAEKEAIQDGFNIAQLYKLQSSAVERFAIVSSAFTIVNSVETDAVSVDLIKNILFRQEEMRSHKIEIDFSLREFSCGLRAYTRYEASRDNDKRVRQAWTKVENLLRRFGRNI